MNGRDWRVLYQLPLDDERNLRRLFPHAVAMLKTALEVFGWLTMTLHTVSDGLIALAGCIAQIIDVLLPVAAPRARQEKKLHFHIAIDHVATRLMSSRTPLELEEEGDFERALREHEKNNMTAGGPSSGLIDVATAMEVKQQLNDQYLRHRNTVDDAKGTGASLAVCGPVLFLPCCLSDQRDVQSMARRLQKTVVCHPGEQLWRVAVVKCPRGTAGAMVLVQHGVKGIRMSLQLVCKCPQSSTNTGVLQCDWMAPGYSLGNTASAVRAKIARHTWRPAQYFPEVPYSTTRHTSNSLIT